MALIAVSALVAAGAGGYFIAGTGSASPKPASSEQRSAPRSAEPAPVKPDPEEAGLTDLEEIIAFAGEGRAAVLDQRYSEGVENRTEVLSRLRQYEAPTARLDSAARRLSGAMEASLAADRDYEAGVDARAHDALAERRKEHFLTLYNRIAREHGARTYREIDL